MSASEARALVERLLDREIFTQIDWLRTVLVLHPDIRAYIMTGDEAALPDWLSFAPAYAVINSSSHITKVA